MRTRLSRLAPPLPCWRPAAAAPGNSPGEFQGLESFETFPLYALGESFQDSQLEAARQRPGYIERPGRHDGVRRFLVY